MCAFHVNLQGAKTERLAPSERALNRVIGRNPVMNARAHEKIAHGSVRKALDTEEQVGNKMKEQRTNASGEPAMLALAISVLFTLTGIIAVATITHSLIGARGAYAQLMREGEVMRAGFALQAAAVDMQLRTARRQDVTPRRRSAPLRRLPHQICAAA